MSDKLEFHLKVAVDPEDHELIDFLRGLADEEQSTRIEDDNDALVWLDVLEVTTTRDQDEAHGALLGEYFGIERDDEDDFTPPVAP